MHLNDANDDLGTAKKPEFMVIACLAVGGELPIDDRLPLLKHTITRLYEKNGCYKVICSGDSTAAKSLCESLGAVWVHHQNDPLGKKWNEAFKAAKQFNPDAVLYVGSSDFVSDNWIHEMEPYVRRHHFVGTAECHFVHIIGSNDALKGVFWKGYKATQFHKDRSDETIGIGRMISRQLMDLLEWKPFYDHYKNSLDRSMKERCKKCGYDDFMMDYGKAKAVSLSTDFWKNKHDYKKQAADIHANAKIDAQKFADEHFPEINMIFK